MSNSYIFSVVGAYNQDPTIFDNLILPDDPFTKGYDLFRDFPKLDKELLITNLLVECAQLSLCHTDTDYLKLEIGWWSELHKLDWQQMYETLLYHYNPIWNKDGVYTEEGSTTGNTSGNRVTNGTSENVRTIDTAGTNDNLRTINTQEAVTIERESSGTESNDNTKTLGTTSRLSNTGTDGVSESGTEDSTVINSVNAFNSGSPTEHDRSVTDSDWTSGKTVTYGKIETTADTGTVKDAGSSITTGTASEDSTKQDTGTVLDEGTKTDTGTISDAGNTQETVTDSGTSSGTSSITRTEKGNIGVTTTQAMIREQREIIMNMYMYIIGQFKERFCILIW